MRYPNVGLRSYARIFIKRCYAHNYVRLLRSFSY